MGSLQKRWIGPVALAAILFLGAVIAVSVVRGRDGTSTVQIVHYPLVTDGAEYRRVAYPEQADTIHVLADTPVVFDARRSEVRFWPITRDYRPDFQRMDEPIDATLELETPDGDVQRLEPKTFTMWYPEGVVGSEPEVLTGDAAEARYEQYVDEARAYAEAAREYETSQAQYQESVDEWLGQAAEGVEPLPEPPEPPDVAEPEQYDGYARDLERGLVAELPAGDYTLRLLDEDGEIIDGSERQLVSIAPSAEGVGYHVLPEERWTQPTSAFDPDAVIYVTGDTAIYLVPLGVERFTAGEYGRLFHPQTVEISNDSQRIWVPGEEIADAEKPSLELRVDGGEGRAETIAPQEYRVQQLPGQRLGYRIEEFDASETSSLEPDFRGLRLELTEGAVRHIELSDAGGTLAASGRTVRHIQPAPWWLLYAPAFIPVAAYGFVLGRRRRRLARVA